LQLGVLAGSAQTNIYLFSGSVTNITLPPGTYIITAYGAPQRPEIDLNMAKNSSGKNHPLLQQPVSGRLRSADLSPPSLPGACPWPFRGERKKHDIASRSALDKDGISI
jgi:hypothetical protein